MITSALISEARREYGDVPKKTRVTRNGDGSTNLFNLGKFPVIEGSESVSISGGAALTSGGVDFTLDRDSGDLTMSTTPASGDELKVEHKFAHWRDQNWTEVINEGIGILNSRGFFKQIVRNRVTLSGGTKIFSAVSACVDVYELVRETTSGQYGKFETNWSYQQDANKVILGNPTSVALSAAYSYLRRLQTYGAVSATLDVPSGAVEPLKKYAGAMFFRSLAAKNALQGNASIDEGHFSFSNLRTMANDLLTEFDNFATRSKPTRPAKDLQYHIHGGGIA